MAKKIGRLGRKIDNKKEAQRRERKLAKRLEGRATPNSGAIDGMRADVITENWCIDDKFTRGDSYIMGSLTLSKLTRESWEYHDKTPMLIVKFYSKKFKIGTPNEWAIIPEENDFFPVDEVSSFKKVIKTEGFSFNLKLIIMMVDKSLDENRIEGGVLEFKRIAVDVPKRWIVVPLYVLEDYGVFKRDN